MLSSERQAARRRALRAAQLVTLSLSLATGCGAATAPRVGDGGIADAGHDAGHDGGADAGVNCDAPHAPCGVTDGLCNRGCGFTTFDMDCCMCPGAGGCAITGPFVPPAMA